MPYRNINQIQTIETIADVFELTASLLHKITNDWNQVLIEKEYRTLLKKAFSELEERSYQTTYNQLNYPIGRQNDLTNEGLWETQAELKLKIFVINSLWNKFLANPIVKILKAILEFLNKLLKSLEKVFPPLGAWKEMKDVIEALIKQYTDLNDVPLPFDESPTLTI